MTAPERRALVWSGGGRYGALQAGANLALREAGIEYDVEIGISVGSINSIHQMQFLKGHQAGGAQELVRLWKSIDNASVKKQHSVLGWMSMLRERTMWSTAPLRETMKEHIDVAQLRMAARKGRDWRCGAVALEDGEYREFGTELFNDEDDLFDAILASSAFPLMLEYQSIEGKTWVDGGVRNMTPIHSAIMMGCDRIDVLHCGAPEIDPAKDLGGWLPAIKDAGRVIEIMLDEVVRGDIDAINHQLRGRRFIDMLLDDLERVAPATARVRRAAIPPAPTVSVLYLKPSSGSALDFSPGRISLDLEAGYAKGKWWRDSDDFRFGRPSAPFR